MDKRALFRQHFFKYISKAEFALGVSSVFGTIATTMVSGYSSYLGDRNARIERLNNAPLNYIYVDYISFDEYARRIDRRNWKPASERIQKQKQEEINAEEKKTIQYKKQELIKTINSWLVNKTKKQQQNNSELDDESLKRLAEINGKAMSNNQQIQNVLFKKNDTEKKKDDNFTLVNKNSDVGVSKISELTGRFNKRNLPPSKKKVEQTRYFVVQEGDSVIRYDPKMYKKANRKQRAKLLPSEKETVGKIANREIKKDSSIFESLINIWNLIISKKEPRRYGRVIHSGYDQYGNRIDKNSVSYSSSITNNKRNVNNADEDKKEIVFVVPTFVIDGSIAKISNDFQTQQDIINGKTSKRDLEMLVYLEYTLETCWYKEYSSKNGQNIASTFTLHFSRNGKLQNIKLNYFDNVTDEEKQKFIKDFVGIIKNCDISGVKNMTQNNYHLWGQVKLEFR